MIKMYDYFQYGHFVDLWSKNISLGVQLVKARMQNLGLLTHVHFYVLFYLKQSFLCSVCRRSLSKSEINVNE